MLPYQVIEGGRYSLSVTGGVASAVSVFCTRNDYDFILTKSITGWGEASDAQAIEWWKERSMAQGTAKGILQASEGSTPQLPAMTSYTISSGGITLIDTSNPPTYAALTATAITAANPAVVSMADTGSIVVGDVVRIYAATGMQQISGMDFTVTAVTTNVSITLGYLDASGFAAPATAAQVLKFIPSRWYPRYRYITNITQASQAVVTFSVAHDFTAGEILGFKVPSSYGMSEISAIKNGVRVLSTTASTVTLDLDTSGFTAFSFPTSAEAAGGAPSPAVAVPSASGVVPLAGSATVPQQPPGTNLLDAFDNRNTFLINFGAGLFNVSGHDSTNGDTWMWQAIKYDNYTTT